MNSKPPENIPPPLFPFFTAKPIKELLKAIERSASKPLLIAICGGSCSGKTSLAEYLVSLNIGKALPMDAYYKPVSEIREYADGIPAFDAPDAFELPRLTHDLNAIRNGQAIEVPVYLYQKIKDGRDSSHTELFVPTRVTFLDGILSCCEELRPHIDFSLFIERDNQARRRSRIERDREERGVPAKQSAILFDTMQTALFKEFILPQKQAADYAVVNAP
ncbi:uridine kinase [Candidatus Electrothrix marina]|uniref:Uridine kinase n=1 Tax=Candidatus Electrothrix marina TaxID=1859130 RepID=A0A444JG32_9BACT|nr:uridine kinase [Candidatus Electrothrix marina]